jgi:hypothetical protein
MAAGEAFQMKEVAVWSRAVRAQMSGSWRWSQSTLGPTAWEVSDVPARSRIAASPIRSFNSAISAVALVSTP